MKQRMLMFFWFAVACPGLLRGEIADPVYRDGIIYNLNEHAALSYRYDNGNAETYVVHSAGGGSHEANSVRVGNWSEFLGDGNFTGKRNKGISKSVRLAILSDGLDQLGAYYWGYGPFTWCWMSPNSSPASGDGCFRCDGLVEWCYEQNGNNICNDAALFSGGPKYQRGQLPPENDVAPTGVTMTYPSATSVNDPTRSYSLRVNLKASARDDHSGLSFNRPYEYFMSRWTNGAWTAWANLGKGGSNHSIDTVPNTYYAFYVQVCDNDSEKANSSVYYLLVQDDIDTPTGLTASQDTCDQVRLHWNNVPGALDYWVFRDDVYVGAAATNRRIDVPGDTAVHIYEVAARSSTLNLSARSEGVEGVMGGIPPVPPGVMASDGSFCDQIRVYWGAVDGALKYQIYRDGVYLEDALVPPYIDIVTGSHTYWVMAENGCGTSEASAEAEGFTATLPATPTGLSASTGTYCGVVQVAWNAVSNAMGYEVYREGTQICEVAGLSFDDAVEGTHAYSVKAKNQCGTSEASTGAIGYAAVELSAPAGVVASGGTYSDRIQLGWNAVDSAAGYEVWRNTLDVSGSAQCVGSGIVAVTWADVNIERGTSYYYWVNATNACGPGPMSDAQVGYAQEPAPIWEIVATATEGGTIVPSGTVMVANESNQIFTVSPVDYFYISNVVVDGISMGATNAYEFAGVASNRTIHAMFEPSRTSQGVPHAWLAAHGLTNQPWDEAAAAEHGNGMTAWESWVAGTDPTNPATAFRVEAVEPTNGRAKVTLRTVPGRRYTFSGAMSLASPDWRPLDYGLTADGDLTNGTLEATAEETDFYLPAGDGRLFIRPVVESPGD